MSLSVKVSLNAAEFEAAIARKREAIGPALRLAAADARAIVISRLLARITGSDIKVRSGHLAEEVASRGGAFEYAPRTGEIARAKGIIGSGLPYSKAVVETGSYTEHPGGTPFIRDRRTGRITYLRKENLGKFEQTMPHVIRQPKRFLLSKSMRAARNDIRAAIVDRLRQALTGDGGAVA